MGSSGAERIGSAIIYLDSLSYLLEIEECTPAIDFKEKQAGEVVAEVIPISVGDKNLINSIDDHHLSDYMGKSLTLEVRVIGARAVPKDLATNCQVKFGFWGATEQSVTKVVEGFEVCPQFDFTTRFTVDVDQEFVDHVANEAIELELWGMPAEVLYDTSNLSEENGGSATISISQLKKELRNERVKRKKAEARLAELVEHTSSPSISEDLPEDVAELQAEVVRLRKQLAAVPKSGACSIS